MNLDGEGRGVLEHRRGIQTRVQFPCHVERSETSLTIRLPSRRKKGSEILRFAQNDKPDCVTEV
jgi:hypothetical protein